MGEAQHTRRVSVAVREGPKEESRTGKVIQQAIHECFNCCNGESCSQHRKSLADKTLRSESFTGLAETMTFAREGVVKVAPRKSGTGGKGDVFVFGNQTTGEVEDENLDDFQKAVRCLKSEYKTFAAENFHRLLDEDASRAMTEVWPNLERELKLTARNAAEIPSDVEPTADSIHEPASRKFPADIVHLYKVGNAEAARKLIGLLFQLIPCPNKQITMYWGECLEKLVEACTSTDIQKDIYPKIVELAVGKESTSINGKIGACRVLRKLARRFNSEVIERKVFPMMDSLAKDPSPEVRVVAASCLPEMIHRLKNKDEALELINLIKGDADPTVRAVLTSTILKSVSLMNPRDEKNKAYLENMMHAIKVLVKDAYGKGNIDLLVAYSEHMGYICEAFTAANILKGRDVLWYLDAYLQLSRYDAKKVYAENLKEEDEMPRGFANFRANMEFTKRHSIVEALMSTKTPTMDERSEAQKAITKNEAIAILRENAGTRRMSVPYGGVLPPSAGVVRPFGPDQEKAHECRRNAAKQFYEFMIFANPIVGFRHGLHPLVSDLMHDPHPEVRAAMTDRLLPIMEHVGGEVGVLHGDLVYALSDDDLDVIQALVPNLSRILKLLVTAKVLSPELVTSKLVEIGGALLYCEERLNQTTFYKVHQVMLDQFTILPFCFPGDYIYNNFVPALLHRLRHMRVLPCRISAANAIIMFLRHCRRSSQREEIRKRIRTGFAQGRSVHDRMLFLYMAKKMMEKFSRKYFQDHFFEDVLALANDPVVNVRRKVMELMPELNDAAVDASLHQHLEDTFHQARKTEVDPDVIEKITEVVTKINQQKEDSSKHRSSKHKSIEKLLNSQRANSDPADVQKELEEKFIEGLEAKVHLKEGETIEEKRKTFFGSNRRKSVGGGEPKKAGGK